MSRGRERKRKWDLPEEKHFYLLVRLNDSYTYYDISKNRLAVCSGSPTPMCDSLQMRITFNNENDVIMYALEKVITYCRRH